MDILFPVLYKPIFIESNTYLNFQIFKYYTYLIGSLLAKTQDNYFLFRRF